MLRVVVLTPNITTSNGIHHLLEGSESFEVVLKATPIPFANEVVRIVSTQEPDVVLLDLQNYDEVSAIPYHLANLPWKGVLVGFRTDLTKQDRAMFENDGLTDLLPDPFSIAALEAATYDAMHRKWPIASQKLLAFLPAKAGGGCSTVVLNTAAALANHCAKKVLLAECDRRSGILSILLNLENPFGLNEALENSSKLSTTEWRKYIVQDKGVDLLLANPAKRGLLPNWVEYHQLLRFAQKEYDYILADLPEVINQATAEVVRCSQSVFVVCEPEVASLKLAGLRCLELESCGIPSANIHIVLNRFERDHLSLADVEKIVGRSVFASLPNDYRPVQDAAVQSQLVSANSKFAEACRSFARKLSGAADTGVDRSKFTLLRKLSKLAS